jgi:hypothetical protein
MQSTRVLARLQDCEEEHKGVGEKQAAREHQSWMSLFQPDVLAPVQYFERWRRRRWKSPEIMLMFAVLEDGIACFQKFSSARSRHGKAMFREAEIWLMQGHNDGLYAFENICDVVGLDPNYIRAGLCRWQRSGSDQ